MRSRHLPAEPVIAVGKLATLLLFINKIKEAVFERRSYLVGNWRRLDVVATQVLLEVQDRQFVSLGQRQQFAQRRIGVDRLLVHQAVGLRVGHHTLRDRRAADLSALGLAQEGAQFIRDLHGLREDAGLGLSTRRLGRGPLAAAIRTLRKARRLLLDRLQRSQRRVSGRLQRVQLLLQSRDGLLQSGTKILLDCNGGDRGSLDGDRGGHRRRGRNLRGGGSSGSLRRLLADLGGRHHGGSDRDNRRRSGNSLDFGSLLRSDLGR